MNSALLRRINIQRSEQLSQIGINPLTNFFCIGDSKGFLQIINYPQIITQTHPQSREESFSQNQNINCFQIYFKHPTQKFNKFNNMEYLL